MKGIDITFTHEPDKCCPKCSVMLIVDYTFFDRLFRRKRPKAVRKHIKECKSTAVEDRVKKIGDMIDKMIMDEVMKEVKK